MATTNKYLTYRGDLRAVAACAKGLAFTTVHPEGRPTALYLLDAEKLELNELPLECGGLCLAAAEGNIWLSGDNAALYQHKGKAKSLSKCKVTLSAPATALVSLPGDRLAALCDDRLLIIDTKKDKATQTLELQDKGTAIAADPTGEWLAVGTSKGTVSVYECEQQPAYQLSESAELHKGAVTSILFEPEELRFFTAGADQKLLLTHARGTLEPEDRGRGASHSDLVTAMLHVPGDRFVTASRDKTCKTWTRAGATRPATFDDAVPAVVAAAIVEIHARPHLVVAGEDNTLRFILIDTAGRFASMTHRLYDAYARAEHLLSENDVSQRGDAIHALAGYDDTRAVELLARQITQDSDHGLRLRATELLSKSQHPRAAKILEPLLKHADEKVRLQAFAGLRAATDKNDLRPLELAIATKQADVGTAAVTALQSLAKEGDLARQLLIRALDVNPAEVRRAALLSLEKVFPKNSPEPTLIASRSGKHDTRQLALIRSFHRKLLGNSRILGTIRRSSGDKNADVRRTAFLIALLSRDKLAKAVRQRDKDLHRQLFELEQFDVESKPKAKSKAKNPPAVKLTKFSLTADDYEPLLSAISSRAVDTCLLGAHCLALLADPRAFGILLQLSREEEAATRVQVCESLTLLTDARAAQRLETLLNDSAAEVRDAAYTAIENLKDPLEAADTGLKSSHADVRRRALKTLSAALRKSKAKTIKPDARELMLRALNDADESISGEAFKTSLGLKIDGSQEATLRFALQSVRAQVRGEVLTEAMAHDKQAWAEQLLVDLLNDPDPQIRSDAYEHLLKKSKGRDIVPMQAALKSRHADIRLCATQSLVKLKTKAAQEALVTAINDKDPQIRAEALSALINLNAVDILQQAMKSQYSDVRLRAACARALFHDEQAKIPLVQAATADEPERDADKPEWQQETLTAVSGLGMLGLEEFVPLLLPLLDSPHAPIRHAAAAAITQCARPGQIELLNNALQHSDPQVASQIALGLALCQVPSALPIVFSESTATTLSDRERLQAAVAYGDSAETHLVALLESPSAEIRNTAFFVLLARDWRRHDGTPAHILAALSAHDPRIRLAAAHALETFAEPEAIAQFVVDFVNDRGEEQAWSIPAATVESLANLIVLAEPHCQAQTVTLMKELAADQQEQWDFAWQIHTARHAAEVDAANKSSTKHKLPKLKIDSEELSQLAFGTYVGLVREQGGYHERGESPAFGTTVIAIRQAAIRRLVAMAAADESMVDTVRPILIQALGDELQDVRQCAFERLPQVGADDELRAAAAIECGHTDLAVAALKLLTAAAGKKGQQVLEDVVLTRDDHLAAEAGELLRRLTDATTAAKVGLESPHDRTRMLAIGWLANDYDDNPQAQKALVAAYQSRYQSIRIVAAVTLATKKDKHAFDMLCEQLGETSNPREQSQVVNALTVLGDPRSPDSLIDALTTNEDKSLDPSLIFAAVGSFRLPDSAPRLLSLLDRPEWQNDVARAVVTISGHDQHCHDPEDDLPDRQWMEEQFPRHDDVLASYLERCLDLNLPNLIQPHINAARWSLTDAVDHVLALLSVHPDDVLRYQVVEALGWRSRKRNGPADPLIALLEHRDTLTKFRAAAALARGGHNNGVNILLSAAELMPELPMRALAVMALGELADERSLDLLLRLASDNGHALQDTATEAIGHLGKSDKADDIFALLKSLANSNGSVASRAIIGLRWFNTPAGWDIVREHANTGDDDQGVALEQLGYNDDPATRTFLLDLIRSIWTDEALPSAKRLFGEESLEPDYAALQSQDYSPESWLEHQFHCLKRVCRDGDADRIFEILPQTSCQHELAAALIQRDPPPLAEAVKAIDSPHADGVYVAASIVGRDGNKAHGKQLAAAIDKWIQIWNDRLQQALHAGESHYLHDDVENETRALCRILWAAGRTGAAKAQLLTVLQSNEEVGVFVTVRRAAMTALAECKLAKTELTAIEQAIDDADADIRRTAAEILARQDAPRATKHAGDLLSDRAAFRRISAQSKVDASTVSTEAADHAHYQAIVLPQLVAAGDVSRLGDVADNSELGEATRLGAIEGLAKIADKSANKRLITIGKNEEAGDELRKAAWRSLRRTKRAQTNSKK